MRKMLFVTMLLSLAINANAQMSLSSDNYNLEQNGLARLTLFSTLESARGGYYIGIDLNSSGNGILNIDNAQIDYSGSISNIAWEQDAGISSFFNVQDPHIVLEFDDQIAPLNPVIGTLTHNIIFQGTAAGDVTIDVFNGAGTLLNGITIMVTPEPMTIGLLGLGAMFLRRRK